VTDSADRLSACVFTNPVTGRPYSASGIQHIFRRALVRADIRTGDVSFHTLRHTYVELAGPAGEPIVVTWKK
jgi:integrase